MIVHTFSRIFRQNVIQKAERKGKTKIKKPTSVVT